MFRFRGNSRTFRWSEIVFNGFFIVKLVLFRSFGSSTSSMLIFRGNSRTFRWSGMVLITFCMVTVTLVLLVMC